jgi:hypothetical protein
LKDLILKRKYYTVWQVTVTYLALVCSNIEKNSCIRKILEIIEISPIGHLGASFKQDLKFYARFLAIYVSQMKRDRVLKDHCFDGNSLKEESEEWKEKAEEKNVGKL